MIDLTTLIRDWLLQQETPLIPIDIYRFPIILSATGLNSDVSIWANENMRIGAVYDTSVHFFRTYNGSKLDIKLDAADPEFFKRLKEAFRAAGAYN